MLTKDELRAQMREGLVDGTIDERVLRLEAQLKRMPAGSQGPAQSGQSCACWRGQLCKYHNWQYHGVKP